MNDLSDAPATDITAELCQDPAFQRGVQLATPNQYRDLPSGGLAQDEETEAGEALLLPPSTMERPLLADSALHGPAGEIVRRLAPHTEADPAAMYAQLLTGVGSLIGPGAWFVADGARHHANLFTVIAGRTAKARKGTSWARVSDVLQELDELWFSTRVKSGIVSGEGIVEGFREEEHGEKRLLLVEGEFAQVLQCLKREGNTLSVLLRNAWDGTRISVLRRRDPIQVDGAHISMIGHITLPELHRLLASVDISNGMANRCLWVFADRRQRLPWGGGTPDLSGPLDQLHTATHAARHHGEMRLHPSARELWAGIYDELGEEPHGLLGEILSRGEAQVMRIALLLALLDRAPAIECRHLQGAMAFWRYCEASAAYIFAQQALNPRSKRILDALQQHGSLNMSQVYKLFGNRASKAEIEQSLRELSGKIHLQTGGLGGAVTVRLVG